MIQRVGVPPVVVQQNSGPLKRVAKARSTQSKMQVAVTSSLFTLSSLSLSPPLFLPLPVRSLSHYLFFKKKLQTSG